MLKKISIIGGGEIGKAVSYIVRNSGVKSEIWDKDQTKSSADSPEECFADTESVFFCVPSWVVRSVLTEFLPLIPLEIPLIFVSKGLEAETGLTAPEIAAEFVEKRRIVFMGGPMIAEEIIAGKGGHAVFGGDAKAVSSLIKIFKGKNISSETADDAFSIAILGVLKNIYALIIGAAEGSGMGDNVKAYLFADALKEMDIIIRAMGGEVSVINPAGIGDFLATSLSQGSSNRKTGFDFASGIIPQTLSEGAASIEAVIKRLEENPAAKLPFISFILKMIKNNSINEKDWSYILNG